jgi:hypothetical protein
MRRKKAGCNSKDAQGYCRVQQYAGIAEGYIRIQDATA